VMAAHRGSKEEQGCSTPRRLYENTIVAYELAVRGSLALRG
jgi:hypothetical protein